MKEERIIPLNMFTPSIPMFFWNENLNGDMSRDIRKVLALGYSRVYDEEMDEWYTNQHIVDENGFPYEGDYDNPWPAFNNIIIQGHPFHEMVSYVIKREKKEEEEARQKIIKILHELGCPIYSRGEDGGLVML